MKSNRSAFKNKKSKITRENPDSYTRPRVCLLFLLYVKLKEDLMIRKKMSQK